MAPPRHTTAEVDPTPTPPPVAVEPPAPARKEARRHRGATLAALTLLAGFASVIAGAVRSAREADGPKSWVTLAPMVLAATPDPSPEASSEPPLAEAKPDDELPHPRADEHVKRQGYAQIPQGILFVPSSFASADGTYDLLLHFHGNTRVVRESAEHAGVNAAVAVVNIGKNSAPYLDAFAAPDVYEQLLGQIGRALGERGLDHPTLRRVALSSWSGGYGAISRIIEHGRGLSSLDAVLVLDGIHCGFLEDAPNTLNTRIISPFIIAAKDAAEGKFLFSITHSEIEPPTYAGTAVTASYLLDVVHGRRGAPGAAPEHLALRAAEGAVAKKLEKRMEPISEARAGMFHVRGYRGNTPEHHMAHLLQMGATVMPELAERWRSAPRRPAHSASASRRPAHAASASRRRASQAASASPRLAPLPASASPRLAPLPPH